MVGSAFVDPPIEIESAPRPSASVIWLHGLGADGSDFVPIVPELGLPATPGVRFIFPHAPMRPVTINGGYIMRAWYDLAPAQAGLTQNRAQLDESGEYLGGLVAREMARGIPANCIVLAGFSQGGTVAMHAGLRLGQKIAGLLILSAPILHVDELVEGAGEANAETLIFLAHGTEDPVVPFPVGERTCAALRKAGRPVAWHAYQRMAHSVCAEEIADIGRWLDLALRHCKPETLDSE